MCLLRKKPHPVLSDKHELSQGPLQGLLQQLPQTPDIFQEYDSVIHKQLEVGIIQPIPDSDLGIVGQVHYLPHHAVVKQEKKTTKVRVVYDRSAFLIASLYIPHGIVYYASASLIECLFTGPKFNHKILDILLRFRSYSSHSLPTLRGFLDGFCMRGISGHIEVSVGR